jgi:hypothetical protein
MSRASEAYTALQHALQRTPAECLNVDLFIADDLTPADTDALAAVCASCPVLALCTAYAQIARPTGGYWAGHRSGWFRAQKNRRATTAKGA